MRNFKNKTVVMMEERLARGMKIPGSKYYRYYCSACEEPMRVSQKQLTSLAGKTGALACEACSSPRNLISSYQALSPHQESVRFRKTHKEI